MKAHAKQAVPATPSKVPQAQQPDRKAPEQALVDLSHLAHAPVAAAPADEAGTLLDTAGKPGFLVALRQAVTEATSRELAGSGWTADQCPYIEYWFNYYERRSARDIEAALRKYAPDAAFATTLADYVGAVVLRVRAAVARWSTTGDVDAPDVGMPDALATLATLGPGEPIDSSTRTRFERALAIDLSETRVHRDGRSATAAASEGARAFAIGDHVAFGANQYAPGTVAGDALLAHELAHTRQQDGARGASAGSAHEANADGAAIGWMKRLWGGITSFARPPLATTGLQLQRCQTNNSTPHAVDTIHAVTEAESGISIKGTGIQRDGDKWVALTGRTVHLDLETTDGTVVYWKNQPAQTESIYSKIEGGQTTEQKHISSGHDLTFDEAGDWVVVLYLKVPDHGEVAVKLLVTVKDEKRYAKAVATSQAATADALKAGKHTPEQIGKASYTLFRLGLASLVERRLGTLHDQPSLHDMYIVNRGANPSDSADNVSYGLEQVPVGAASYKWTRDAQQGRTDLHPRSNFNGGPWRELATARTQTVTFDGPDTYEIGCQAYDKDGNALGPRATYTQIVIGESNRDFVHGWSGYLKDIDQETAKLRSVARLPGAFVSRETAEAMPLALFVGESKAAPGTWVVLDLTPFPDKHGAPGVHEHSADTLDEAILAFEEDASHRYPKGTLLLLLSGLPGHETHVEPPEAGTGAGAHAPRQLADTLEFSGGEASVGGSISHFFGLASLGFTVAGFAALLFGAEPAAMAFFQAAAGTGAASSAVSLGVRISEGDTDALGYFIDSAALITSLISFGQASGFRSSAAAAEKSAAAEVVESASRRKFFQWTEGVLTKGSAIVISFESIGEIEKVLNDSSLTDTQRAERLVSLFKQLALQAGILALSARGHPPPAAAKNLRVVEQQILSSLDQKALDHLANLPEKEFGRVVALVLDHPAQVNAALKNAEITTVADLESALQKPAPSVVEPPAAVVNPPTPTVEPTAPAKPVEPTANVEPAKPAEPSKPAETKPAETKPVEKPAKTEPSEPAVTDPSTPAEPTAKTETAKASSEENVEKAAEQEKQVSRRKNQLKTTGTKAEQQAELAKLKAQTQPVASAPESYRSYWEARMGQLEAEAAQGQIISKAPLTLEEYNAFRGRFERGLNFQNRTHDILWAHVGEKGAPLGLENKVLEDEVGMLTNERQQARKAGDRPPRADHVLLDPNKIPTTKLGSKTPKSSTPEIDIEVISDKSRVRADYAPADGARSDKPSFRTQVEGDIAEVQSKYSGSVEIRSSKFGEKLNGRSARVKTIYLMYDMAGLDAAAMEEIVTIARDSRSGVQILFSDGQRIHIPGEP